MEEKVSNDGEKNERRCLQEGRGREREGWRGRIGEEGGREGGWGGKSARCFRGVGRERGGG
jgi:hypothetical protein